MSAAARPGWMHEHRVRSDNRIDNLRLATRSQNEANKRIRSDNKSGFKGVCFHKGSKLWVSRVNVDGVRRVKYFRSKESAVADYRTRAVDAFGEYARVA